MIIDKFKIIYDIYVIIEFFLFLGILLSNVWCIVYKDIIE